MPPAAQAILPDDPVVAAARRLLGPGIAVAGGRVADWQRPLWPGEEAAVARAVPGRRAEFAAGRAAARAALAALGAPPAALPRRPDGPPLWPAGLTGSLSHGGGHVLAALGRLGPGLRALGLDVEPFAPLAPDLAAEMCRPDEDASRALQVFGAKEAAYKAQFMLTGRLLGFGAMRVSLDPLGSFEAEVLDPAVPGLGRLSGRQAMVGPVLLSVVAIRRTRGDDLSAGAQDGASDRLARGCDARRGSLKDLVCDAGKGELT